MYQKLSSLSILFVSAELDKLLDGERLRKGGNLPKLTDVECITIFIVSETIRIDTNIRTWHYINDHWKHFF